MYECVICHSLNHSSRHHCAVCGTTPEKYSMLGVPAVLHDSNEPFDLPRLIPIACAAHSHSVTRTSKASLKTVELDYYAEGE